MKDKAFLQSIKPAVRGESDKFSWRLYQRANKKGREQVFLMSWCPVMGKVDADPDQIKSGFVPASKIAVGSRFEDVWFHGAHLSQITRPGAPLLDWAFSSSHGVAEWVEITDWFWTRYQQVGRCLFHRDVHYWVMINRNARKCAYCGLHERRRVETVKKIDRVEMWGVEHEHPSRPLPGRPAARHGACVWSLW